ncbi:uncharacterized protein LOC114401189 isoform X1 [Glycine soja]|uniref:DUF7271 domain-containing protein n=1 Tax=Glycine soja TaxID=3848 RepID=A0A445F1Q8_GLYSO|nr:uncharacterized protein LOC114401189 isoform X1 [Glycine soja]RZB42733.1 hypothetical protein D0Y65_053352 [Glycine soja]
MLFIIRLHRSILSGIIFIIISRYFKHAPPNFLGCTVIYQFQEAFHVDRNYIEVPSKYHWQWAPHYPPQVLFDYNGDKHFIKIRKDGDRYYFADGLKEFRRLMGIHEGVMVHFMAPNNNITFQSTVGKTNMWKASHIHQKLCLHGRRYPTYHLTCYPIIAAPPEALNFVAPSSQYITIQGNNGRRYIWRISMHNGI